VSNLATEELTIGLSNVVVDEGCAFTYLAHDDASRFPLLWSESLVSIDVSIKQKLHCGTDAIQQPQDSIVGFERLGEDLTRGKEELSREL
jgi:hypothetical protein